MNLKTIPNLIFAPVLALILCATQSCIEDGVTTSPAHQPLFSADTLDIGSVFTDESTPTFALKVYNRHDKILSLSSVAMASGDSSPFRLNVDGRSGKHFSNVEIRPNDSVFVFVALTPPANGSWSPAPLADDIEILTNGVMKKIHVKAQTQDVERLKAHVVTSDQTWTDEKPRQISDSLVVAEGVTLTLAQGVKLYFHDKATFTVHGTLICEGSPANPVELTGDRRGNVVGDYSFDLMSRQWEGLRFSSRSVGSTMRYTEVRNTWTGVTVDSLAGHADASRPALRLIDCRLRNADSHVLSSTHAWIEAIGCEMAEAGRGPVAVSGGSLLLSNCTLSNYYLFAGIRGALLQLSHLGEKDADGSGLPYLSARVENTILYGSSADMSPKSLDDTDVWLRRCLLRSDGSDDGHFINTIWNADPLFQTRREEYIFDYSLGEGSPAIAAGDPDLMSPLLSESDFFGRQRNLTTPSIGAY